MHIGVSEPRLILRVGSRPWFSLNIHLHRESFGDAALKIHELLENGSWVSILQCPLECDLRHSSIRKNVWASRLAEHVKDRKYHVQRSLSISIHLGRVCLKGSCRK